MTWLVLACALAQVPSGKLPTAEERREALDDMQAAIGEWQRERHEFSRDARAREEHAAQAAEEPAEEPKKVIEVDKPQKPTRYGKIIEVAPEKTELEQELDSAEEKVEAARKRKADDPEGFAREKAHREAVERGNDAFEEAVERRWKKREAEIEAEARRMQQAVDAARRAEELERAKKMGGTLDAEGNFVDPEIK